MSDIFSYSKLDTFQSCKFKYKLRYLDDHYINTPGIALDFGTAVHAAEEAIALAIKAGESIDYTKIKNNFILATLSLEHDFPAEYIEPNKSGRTYKDKIDEYLSTGIYNLEKFMLAHPELSIIGAEIPFNFAFIGHEFKGFIDRVFYDSIQHKYLIQDIKTYAVPVEHNKLVTPLQFVIYNLAVQQLYNCKSSDIYCQYSLPFCNGINQDAGTAGYMERGVTKLTTIFTKIEAADFTPSPSPLCYWCEYSATNVHQPEEAKNLCPYHSLWTKQKKSFATIAKWEGAERHTEILENYIKNYTKQLNS